MVDFAALRAANKAKLDAKRTPALSKPSSRSSASTHDLAPVPRKEESFHVGMSALEAVSHLLKNRDCMEYNDWEHNFLISIKTWMLSTNYTGLSVKQKHVFEKICRNNNLQYEESKVPTRDNRFSDGEYKPPYENRNESPYSRKHGWDDFDDDIPF